MKNSGICPKCRFNSTVRLEGQIGPYGSGNHIPLGFGGIKVTRFLCLNCGFSEEWVEENELEKLKEKVVRLK